MNFFSFVISFFFFFFFFNDTATTEIYTLSLHDALPIFTPCPRSRPASTARRTRGCGDRKSTRLNSSHQKSSYAVFCLKKKKKGIGGGREGEVKTRRENREG